MDNLLNKTFFKFAIGFVAIVGLSLLVTALITYSRENIEDPSADFFLAGDEVEQAN